MLFIIVMLFNVSDIRLSEAEETRLCCHAESSIPCEVGTAFTTHVLLVIKRCQNCGQLVITLKWLEQVTY